MCRHTSSSDAVDTVNKVLDSAFRCIGLLLQENDGERIDNLLRAIDGLELVTICTGCGGGEAAIDFIASALASVLLRFNESFEDTMLEPIKWQIGPDDRVTRGDNGDGDFIHHRQLRHSEQVLEVLRQVDDAKHGVNRNPMTVSDPARKRPGREMLDLC